MRDQLAFNIVTHVWCITKLQVCKKSTSWSYHTFFSFIRFRFVFLIDLASIPNNTVEIIIAIIITHSQQHEFCFIISMRFFQGPPIISRTMRSFFTALILVGKRQHLYLHSVLICTSRYRLIDVVSDLLVTSQLHAICLSIILSSTDFIPRYSLVLLFLVSTLQVSFDSMSRSIILVTGEAVSFWQIPTYN